MIYCIIISAILNPFFTILNYWDLFSCSCFLKILQSCFFKFFGCESSPTRNLEGTFFTDSRRELVFLVFVIQVETSNFLFLGIIIISYLNHAVERNHTSWIIGLEGGELYCSQTAFFFSFSGNINTSVHHVPSTSMVYFHHEFHAYMFVI